MRPSALSTPAELTVDPATHPRPPTDDPADKWVAWRGSASDFVTDMRAVIPPAKLALLRVMLGDKDPPVDTAALARAVDTAEPADSRSVLSRVQRAIVEALPEGATAIGKINVRMPARCDDITLTVECFEGGVVVNTGSSPLTDDESAAFDRQQSRLDAFERGAADPHPPGSRITANVAAFVLKAPALDRLLLVRSGKPGRAWELPGGVIEPGETPADAAGREVVEEAGIYFRAEGSGWTVEGCEVFRGTSHAGLVVPGGDVTSARWFTPDEARPLKLSDLPTAKLIRDWSTPIGEPAVLGGRGYVSTGERFREQLAADRHVEAGGCTDPDCGLCDR